MTDGSEFVRSEYLRMKARWGSGFASRRRARRTASSAESQAFGSGRDPRGIAEVLPAVLSELGWAAEIEQARIITEWGAFVGEPTSDHTEVVGFHEGTLRVQCDSTAWATELRRLRIELVTRIAQEYPEAGVREIVFLTPGAPTWRHGPRTVRGRGPRDTYG